VPGSITVPPCSWGYKYGGLAPQVYGVSNVRLKYGCEFCGTWTREWLLWQGPEAIIQVNYRPILWSERVTKSWNPQLSVRKEKSGHNFQMGARHQDTLADWPSDATKLQLQLCRSQWPRGLRHELSSPAPTLRWWVRIPLRHGCLCVFCVRFFCFHIVSSEAANRPNKRLMRTYHWISLFMYE
jgi:hypothetical protein